MVLPRGDEYNIAIQNPLIAFNDVDLVRSSVEETLLGLPKPYSGGFTITYRLSNARGSWAVRCFHKDIQDLQIRYQAITNFFEKNKSRYFVEAKYLPNGIRVNGIFHPIVKMQWLSGDPLNIYLVNFYSQRSKVERLLVDFVGLVSELDKLGIAHGDLQHGNIVVKDEKILLIDYDGIYLPELATLKTNEIGHINYQHPKRNSSHYNRFVDRFSSIVIYVGLKAIIANPSLWSKYDNGENILFKSKDFADLKNSLLVNELLNIPEIRPLVERLIGCCYLDFERIPTLADFISGNFNFDRNAGGLISITRNQYEVLSASDIGSVLEHFGEKIVVVGKISADRTGYTKRGAPYMFLNFGVYPNNTFTLVIWQEGIAALVAKGMPPSSLVGKYVSVTGVIGSYGRKPQMIIEQPTQIEVLSGQEEVNERLKRIAVAEKASTGEIRAKPFDREADIFNTLYKNNPVHTPPVPVAPLPKPVVASLSKPVIVPPPVKPVYSPANKNNSQPSQPAKNDSNSGCVVPIIFAIIGASLLGSVSDGKLWFLGAIAGGFFGFWIYGLFKS